ncbi:hypothetical protein [Victivallis sp. Marseille-Q1083]|uniref:hypothetical protein n=1 Tax=Victivallis sp. Marseille-Q1083 TaxID=2717288 RepID=UPI00158D51DA|nr:hypothetical protein [Victivallis sp. Marseille-Q1083]
MSEVLKIAEAVADQLAEYQAEVQFAPEFELRDLEEMRVVVVPLSTEYKTLSRANHEELLKVQIGILKRATEDDLTELLRFTEKLGLDFLNQKILDATCLVVAYNPIYSADHLRERNQFTSVIELTFKKIK